MSNVTPTNTIEAPNTQERKTKDTWIPNSPTFEEYRKQGFDLPDFDDDDGREAFVRVVRGVYTRKISAIYLIRTDDDRLWLNWHEHREGKTPMQQKRSLTVMDMGFKKIPVPKEDVEFDLETQEYKTVITGAKEYTKELFVEFTPERLKELFEDINPYKTQFMIAHRGQRTFTVTKAELQQAGEKDFAKVYDSKLNYYLSKTTR